MSKKDWILWAVPLVLWCFYASWHFGYQLGYADGHTTAWKRYTPNPPVAQFAEIDLQSDAVAEFTER